MPRAFLVYLTHETILFSSFFAVCQLYYRTKNRGFFTIILGIKAHVTPRRKQNLCRQFLGNMVCALH